MLPNSGCAQMTFLIGPSWLVTEVIYSQSPYSFFCQIFTERSVEHVAIFWPYPIKQLIINSTETSAPIKSVSPNQTNPYSFPHTSFEDMHVFSLPTINRCIFLAFHTTSDDLSSKNQVESVITHKTSPFSVAAQLFIAERGQGMDR